MIIAYPFSVISPGSTGMTKSVKPQIAMLLNTIPGTRLWDPEYGFNPISLEQTLMDELSPERTLFIVTLQETFIRYLPQIVIQDVTFERGQQENEAIVNIYYATQTGEKDIFVWEPNSNLT